MKKEIHYAGYIFTFANVQMCIFANYFLRLGCSRNEILPMPIVQTTGRWKAEGRRHVVLFTYNVLPITLNSLFPHLLFLIPYFSFPPLRALADACANVGCKIKKGLHYSSPYYLLLFTLNSLFPYLLFLRLDLDNAIE